MKEYDLIIAPLVSLLSVGIGIIIFLNDRKNTAVRATALISVSIGVWIISAFLSDITKNHLYSLLLNRMVFVALCLLMGSLFYLPFVFPNKMKAAKYLKTPLIYFSVIFSIVALVTPFIISDIQFESWGSNLTYGSYFNVFIVFSLTSIAVSIITFIVNYIKLQGEDRVKIKYFFEGLFAFMLITVLVHVVIRNIVGSDEFYRFGNYSAIIFVAFTAYAIIKQQLFNIKIILTETAIALIVSATFVQAVLSDTPTQRIANGVILLLSCYAGWLLIKSVKHEIAQREEIQKLATKLDSANKHLEELDEMKDNFMSMASHELNTPIAAIEGYLSMIMDEHMGGKLNSVHQKYLESVYTSSKRLAALVRDLLNVSRIESNRVHLLYEQQDITNTINQAIMEVGSKVKEAHHSLIFEKPKSVLPKTWFDPTRITEVLINLLGNSIKYTEPGGKIVVSAKENGHEITVAVADNGKGIPKDKQNHVFEKFGQVDVLKDEVKGTGLGMYISKNLIELHKGRIWFHSDGAGKGTTFYITLPILHAKPHDAHEGEGAVLQLK